MTVHVPTLGNDNGGTDVNDPGDAGNVLTSDGANWKSSAPPGPATDEVAFTSSQGDFTIAHGLGYSPRMAIISMVGPSLGIVVFQGGSPLLRWDATNFYLRGSDDGLSGFVEVWR
jgi:hypothetical protein